MRAQVSIATIKTLFFILPLLLLSSCGSSDRYKVVYLYPSSQLLRFEIEGKYMTDQLKKLGVDASMVSADNNDTKQIEQGLKALDEGADMLVIVAVNGNTIAPLVREAKDRNVPVIAYNRLINNVEYDLFFTGHNKDNGRIFCEKALQTHPTGNYVILGGDRFDRNGVEQMQAIDSILKPHVISGDIKIVYETYTENWSRENAAYEMEQIIQTHGKDIDVVIAGYDLMADGVISVLKKHELNGSVFVAGQDAMLVAVQHIYKGDQQLTIYHPHKQLGNKAAEIALAILKGKKPSQLANSKTYNGFTDIPTFQQKSIAITKDNLEKELITTGEYTWSQISN